MKKALLFDIERFATKDGPGCRTVIFFKGCNMNCRWCHNPESIRRHPQMLYNENLCVSCGACESACPQNAHLMFEDQHLFLVEKCKQCLKCTQVCFSGALACVGKEWTIEEILKEVMQDQMLYEKSGGGITLSGGEMMLQADFVQEFLGRCKELGLHVCIESNMSLPWEQYEKVLPFVDLVFSDIKLMDNKEHKKWTGIGNKQILDNIGKLKEQKIPFVVRTPVIPGVNDEESMICEIAHFLEDAPSLLYYELLSYNPLGKSKGIIVDQEMQRMEFDHSDRQKMILLANAAAQIVCTRLDGNMVE